MCHCGVYTCVVAVFEASAPSETLPSVGSALARKFRQEGFSVAVASRNVKPRPDDPQSEGYDVGIRLDMAKPEDVGKAFDKVEEELGSPGSLVVYNIGAYAGAPGGRQDPLSLSFKDFSYGTSVTGVNAFEVASRANQGFEELGKISKLAPKVFIATGNALPWYLSTGALGLSAGKRVLYNIIEASATAYGPSGKRFYYATQVSVTGGPVNPPDPTTHAEMYFRLYKQQEQGNWDVRFLKGGAAWKAD